MNHANVLPLFKAACFIALLAFSQQVSSYGFDAHKIIANAAYVQLNPQAKAMVDKILEDETIAYASVWPDIMRNIGRCEVALVNAANALRAESKQPLGTKEIDLWLAEQLKPQRCKSELDAAMQQKAKAILVAANVEAAQDLQQQYINSRKDYLFFQISKAWHYVNVPPGLSYLKASKAKKGDIISAIQTFRAFLTGSGRTHPIIVKAFDDYMVDLSPEEKHKAKQLFALRFLVHFIGDLHQPLHSGYKADLGGNRIALKWFDKPTNLHQVWDTDLLNGQKRTFSQFEKLVGDVSSTDKQTYAKARLMDWLQEGLELRVVVYQSAKADSVLKQAYMDKHQAMFNRQMRKAAVRMAATLNEIFAK